jgi:hypothetical protein
MKTVLTLFTPCDSQARDRQVRDNVAPIFAMLVCTLLSCHLSRPASVFLLHSHSR